MRSSIRSFFQPKCRDKGPQKKASDGPLKKPVKSPLKVQNGAQEADSPVKRVAKRSRQILDSDEEEDESPAAKDQVAHRGQGDEEALDTKEKVKDVPSHVSPPASSSLSVGAPGGRTAPVVYATKAPMEDDAQEESSTKAAAEARGPDEEVAKKKKKMKKEGGEKKEEEERVERKNSDEKVKKAEGAEKKNEVKEETDDEKGLAVAKKKNNKKKKVEEEVVEEVEEVVAGEVVEKETREKEESPKSQTARKRKEAREQKDKEPLKAPISSFFGEEDLHCSKPPQKGKVALNVLLSVREESKLGLTQNLKCVCVRASPSLPLTVLPSRSRVPYLAVARTFEKIEEDSDDLLCCVYLCLNQLGPAYLGMELGVGETVLMKAVAQKLKEIAGMSGNSAMNKKIDIIKGLFVACRFSEARYIVRSLAGKLRIGLAEQSVLSALSQAVCLSPPGQGFPPAVLDAGMGKSAESRRSWIEEKSLILKQTYCEMPNYDVLIPVLLKEGIDELPNHCKLTPGVPLRPMLAHPTKGVGEVMKRFDEAAFTCEYKYDGERAQIHILESGEVRVFSRNQEDNTSKYPDIVSRVPTVTKDSVTSCVLDAEAVAWDREKKQIQPFQVLTTRKRKDVEASEITVQVCVYAFDLLYLNGESLVRQPLCRRRALLKESFSEVEGEFVFARSIDSNNTDAIAEFLEQSVRDSCEGLMVKTLEKDATYEIAKRSHNWLKLKKDYLDGVGDTVDLCVIGAYLGKGKRAGAYGGFLLACYDDDNEEFQSVCKIGTGFKDEDLEQHYKFLKEHILPKPRAYYRIDPGAEPDVWLDAVQVWEVKCADLSLSPVYKAAMGMVDPEKGISLRFPRFLRIRDDKKPEDATTGAQIADLYKKQQQIQNQEEKADPEDYY
uniref:DNA ligase n=1 Tax=Gasterosteus aculeatus aculeatus TaxID=481459 RepID=A0AAQ4P0H7_GASAC